jgi:hypothetical protein
MPCKAAIVFQEVAFRLMGYRKRDEARPSSKNAQSNIGAGCEPDFVEELFLLKNSFC